MSFSENIPSYNTDELKVKLAEWNNTTAAYQKDSSLTSLISKAAITYPDNIAIKHQSNSITYRQLEDRSNQLAHFFLAEKIQVGDTIGLAVDRSIDMVIALLGIMKAGAAYVPLDPNYPLDRINLMLNDSGVKTLLTSRKYKGQFKSQVKELLIEEVFTDLSEYSETPPQVLINGNCVAYILYTSGSTGLPKGVQIEHRNMVNFLTSMQQFPGISPSDNLLAITTISFDIAGLELYLPLISGAQVLIIDPEIVRDGRELLHIIKTEGISMMQATPYVWLVMLELGWNEMLPLRILCGGEPMSIDLANNLCSRCEALFNMYGPTETTIWSTVKRISSDDKVITIGRPINNTQVYILDENLNPLPPGAIGEIYIAGDGVARGYLNRPELTAERFITDPISEIPGNRMYRTGDLGRYLEDGEIQCLGRIDQQIKIRGYRIESGEIEHQLLKETNIKEAVVIGLPDKLGIDRLVSFVVINYDEQTEQESNRIKKWRETLKKTLPDYMVPDNYIIIPAMPLTPNGKIDRKALSKHTISLREDGDGYVAPNTDMEKLVARIWAEYLGVKRAGIHDNFFDLGGDSFIAVQVMTHIEKETGKRLPLASLFETSTIEKLSKLLEMGENSIIWNSLVPIKPTGNRTPLYIVHGEGSNVLAFSNLAHYVDKDQPIFGLQAKGLNGIDEPLDNLSDIAKEYLEEIIRFDPIGPYLLAGYSFGGYVAVEMRKQMIAMGKEVKMLIMFDTNVEKYHIQSRYRLLFKKLKKHSPEILSLLKTSVTNPAKALTLFKAMFKIANLSETENQEFNEIVGKIMNKHRIALENYQMQPFDDRVYLLKAKISDHYADDTEFLGWPKYATKGVKLYHVPGGHLSMLLPPHVEEFASVLQKAIYEAEQ